jgi:hypothetical protein
MKSPPKPLPLPKLPPNPPRPPLLDPRSGPRGSQREPGGRINKSSGSVSSPGFLPPRLMSSSIVGYMPPLPLLPRSLCGPTPGGLRSRSPIGKNGGWPEPCSVLLDEPGARSLPLISYSSSKPSGKSPPRGKFPRWGNWEEAPDGGVPYGVPGPRDAGLGLESAALRSVDSRMIRAVFKSLGFWVG